MPIRYSLLIARSVVVSSFILATGCDSNNDQNMEPIPKPTIQSSAIKAELEQQPAPPENLVVESKQASPVVVPQKSETPVSPHVFSAPIAPPAEKPSLTLDDLGWPNVPENSLLPEKPETFRLILEEYRLVLEQRRKTLEQRRENRNIDLEEYLSEFGKYRAGIKRYRDGMAAYLESFNE